VRVAVMPACAPYRPDRCSANSGTLRGEQESGIAAGQVLSFCYLGLGAQAYRRRSPEQPRSRVFLIRAN